MADPTRCIANLNAAAGKELGADELEEVFRKIRQVSDDLASGKIPARDGENLASPEALMTKAAEIAAKQMTDDKVRQLRNTELKIAKLAERHAEIKSMTDGGVGQVDAVRRLIANTPDGKSNRFSLESRVMGTSNWLKSRLQDTWEAMGSDYLGFIQQKDKVRELITEMRGQDSGNPLAKKGAQAWLKIAEDARQWFNDRGGKIGQLDDWTMPQHHSQQRVASAGVDQWITDVFPMLDRSKYRTNDGMGMPMSEDELKRFLAASWRSIATNGAADIQPGEFRGRAALSNAHAKHREIHFKDADSYINYWGRYGDKTFADILLGHIDKMGRDIAFLEHFGPNPDAAFRVLRDEAEIAAKDAAPTEMSKIDKDLARLDTLYDYAAGRSKPVADMRIATAFDAIRNLNVAGKLGSAVWSSVFGDKVMLEAMGRVNKLPVWQSWFNELRLLNPANDTERRLLRRQGLMLDYMQSAMYRFGEDLGRSSWTGKMSNAVMRVSGMAAINEWRRGSFGLTMMDTLGHLTSTKTWAEVSKNDIHLLKTMGITEADWKVWKLADLENYRHGNDSMLTPESIARIPDARLKDAGLLPREATMEEAAAFRREAVVKYMGAIQAESNLAIIEPGWSDRAGQVGGLQRGNLRDELVRSFWQFKSFPIAQFKRIWEIGLSRPTMGGKAAFLSSVLLMQTIAGAMMLQNQSLLSGQDPRPMDDWKFWMAAFIKGGSLGIYGDFLFSQNATTRYGSGPLEVLAGPAIGAAANTVTALIKAGNAMVDGKDTHLAANVINITKGFIPAQNLWYTKAATDHIIFQNAQEYLSPGYLANMRARSMSNFKQDWWWAPGEFTPDRAPDMSNAIGR